MSEPRACQEYVITYHWRDGENEPGWQRGHEPRRYYEYVTAYSAEDAVYQLRLARKNSDRLVVGSVNPRVK